MKKIYILSLLIISSNYVFAHGQESADFLRSTGKIYSVVLALVIMFLGIVFYVWRLDKKVKRLEDDWNN